MLIKSFGEFSWLPSSLLKAVELPSIFFMDMDEIEVVCAGYYSPSEQLIAINVDEDEKDIPATIAHEFMHHLQLLRGDDFSAVVSRINDDVSYEEAISQYFNNDPKEYEALLFESKIEKTETNDFWLKKLVIEKGFETNGS